MRVIFRFDDYVVDADVIDLSFSDSCNCLTIHAAKRLTGIVVDDPLDGLWVENCSISDWSAYDVDDE